MMCIARTMKKVSTRERECVRVCVCVCACVCLFIRDHEEGVDEDVEVEGGEGVAGVVVVPHADLHRHDDGGVEQQHPAEEHLPWRGARGPGPGGERGGWGAGGR